MCLGWCDYVWRGQGLHSSPVDHLADELRPVGPHPHALDQTDCNGTGLHLQWYQQGTAGTRGTHTTWMDCRTGALIIRRLTAMVGGCIVKSGFGARECIHPQLTNSSSTRQTVSHALGHQSITRVPTMRITSMRSAGTHHA